MDSLDNEQWHEGLLAFFKEDETIKKQKSDFTKWEKVHLRIRIIQKDVFDNE